MPRFQWGLYQVDDAKRILEIDVEGVDAYKVPEEQIVRLMFTNGIRPDGVTLTPTLAIGYERWTVTWDQGKRAQLLAALNEVFQRFLLFSHQYGRDWQARAAKERMEEQAREVAINVWRATPQEEMGGRSMEDLAKLPAGAYEIIGKGFVWVGTNREGLVVQFHPTFANEKVSKDVRWYLERGTSLAEAIDLFNRQTRLINATVIAGFAVALADMGSKLDAGSVPAKAWSKIYKVMGFVTGHDLFPAPSHRHLFKAATEHFARAPVERRIQELSKKRPIPLRILSAKKAA